MTIKGHILFSSSFFIGGSLLFYEQFTNLYNNIEIYNLFLLYIVYIFATALVDIDEPNSYIGRRLFLISIPFRVINNLAQFLIYPFKIFGINTENYERIFAHRGLTHMFALPLGIFLIGFNHENYLTSLIIISFSAGVFSHQLGDILTNTGIKSYLFPFFIGTNIKSPITFETSGNFESIFNFLLTMIIFLLTVLLYYKMEL